MNILPDTEPMFFLVRVCVLGAGRGVHHYLILNQSPLGKVRTKYAKLIFHSVFL